MGQLQCPQALRANNGVAPDLGRLRSPGIILQPTFIVGMRCARGAWSPVAGMGEGTGGAYALYPHRHFVSARCAASSELCRSATWPHYWDRG